MLASEPKIQFRAGGVDRNAITFERWGQPAPTLHVGGDSFRFVARSGQGSPQRPVFLVFRGQIGQHPSQAAMPQCFIEQCRKIHRTPRQTHVGIDRLKVRPAEGQVGHVRQNGASQRNIGKRTVSFSDPGKIALRIKPFTAGPGQDGNGLSGIGRSGLAATPSQCPISIRVKPAHSLVKRQSANIQNCRPSAGYQAKDYEKGRKERSPRHAGKLEHSGPPTLIWRKAPRARQAQACGHEACDRFLAPK